MQSAFVFNTNPIIYFVYFLCSCSAPEGCLGRWWALLGSVLATVFPFQQSISPWLLLFPLLPFRIWFSLTHTLSLSLSNLFTITSILLLMFSRLLSSILYIKIVDEQRRCSGYVCWNILNFLKRSKKRTEKDKEITLVNIEENKKEEIHVFIIIITLSYRRKKKGAGLPFHYLMCEKGSTNLTGKNLNFFIKLQVA